MSLILHCGASAVPFAKVEAVPTPLPTETHVPIGHAELVNLGKDVLMDRGWRVVSEAHALSRKADNYFGLLELSHENDSGPTRTTVGFRNSHSFQYAAAMAVGGLVTVCDNLLFSGQVVLGRRHTKNIMLDIRPLMSLAIGRIAEFRLIERRRFAAYQDRQVNRVQADHLLMNCIRQNIVPPSVMGKVVEDMDFPGRRHPEFEQWKGTLFGLYMAITEHTKGSIWQGPKRCDRLHGLLDGEALFKPSNPSMNLSLEELEVEDAEFVELA